MIPAAIAYQRLAQQRLSRGPFATPAEVVAWLGAVQAQDFPGTKWALSLRCQDVPETVIDQAFNAGAILRTHILRPTWHFVAPADIRWMQALTAPRVKGRMASYFRQNKLDEALFGRAIAVIARALQGGRRLTRVELGACLAEADVLAMGLRLILILHRAELDGVITSGPRRGKQFTYCLLEERVSPVSPISREEALAELTRRYFTGHGPATANDFAWWSGLIGTDAKAGLALAASKLDHAEIDGRTYWFSTDVPEPFESKGTTQEAFLIPTFDEYLVGFAAYGETRSGGRLDLEEDNFASTILIGGRVAGRWRRVLKKNAIAIQLAPFARLDPTEARAVSTAAERYGHFLGRPVDLCWK